MIQYRLQFFAKEGPGGEKTEEATPKKLNDARKEGQVAKSTELVNALSLTALFLVLRFFGGFLGNQMIEDFAIYFNKMSELAKQDFTPVMAAGFLKEIAISILIAGLPIYIGGFFVTFLGEVGQIKWQVTGKPLMPKFNKLNPISGFKKIFSKDKLVELVKSIFKIIVILYVVYSTLKGKWKLLLNLYDMGFYQALSYTFDIVVDLGLKISLLFLVIGFADFYYQRMKFKKDMRMTKQEIKDEYKQSEGDPQIKGKIRQKMREASRRRMMQELPTADVVITNPTHFAVAIRYDKEKASAPVVIAKGADYLAQTIKEAAKKSKIEIVENKPLARMLYFNVEIGDEIPPELYQMVAEVLAYVYKVKGKALN